MELSTSLIFFFISRIFGSLVAKSPIATLAICLFAASVKRCIPHSSFVILYHSAPCFPCHSGGLVPTSAIPHSMACHKV